ncbi:hypothetical protein BC938DRAFT_478545 [Jimgerdemannia flammicorona]|uniref:GDP-fucose protein O-fucosyltransferase 2 n=1 Tax=Jimgerdemannia flammicorona TaxID=994334 RepID=A0A433QMR2_9FUNG|nr:hypothetical protein BC938DRAFT_478545 [Jimgerdemannia flammicorona]
MNRHVTVRIDLYNCGHSDPRIYPRHGRLQNFPLLLAPHDEPVALQEDALQENSEHHDRFLTLNYITGLGLNNLSYHPGICMIEGHYVNNRSDDAHSPNRWGMPIANFFDLAYLRQYVKVITVTEFLQRQLDRNPTLHHISAALASNKILEDLANGGLNLQSYAPDLTFQNFNMFNYLHRQQEGVIPIDDTAPILDLFRTRLPNYPPADPSLEEDVARDLLELDDIVEAPIWGYINIFNMAIDQEYNMTVRVLSPREWSARDPKHGWIAPDESIDWARKSRGSKYAKYSSPIAVAGLRQRLSMPDLHNVQILHLDGDAHNVGFHPVKFSSLEGRRVYDNVVLDWVRFAKPVWDTYKYAKGKMDRRTGGKPYLTFHLRRGDFLKLGWIGSSLPDPDKLITIYQRAIVDLNLKYKTMVLDKWDADRQEATRHLAEWESATSLTQDNAQPGDPPIPTLTRPPIFDIPSPLPLSPYTFIATDEEDWDIVTRLNVLNGTTLFNLLADDRHDDDQDQENYYDRNYQLAVFRDWLGMVDQLMCRDGWWFVGSDLSSVTGGVFNLRKGLALDAKLTSYIREFE